MCQVLTITAVVVVGCFGQVEKDDRPISRIEPTQSFRLEIGRGSGWHGLDTIKLDQEGHVVLHRMKEEMKRNRVIVRWETATLQLRPHALGEVLESVESNGLLRLRKAYSDKRKADGTQWVLWITQGEMEKVVYFNNSFPQQIVRFAEELDAILSASDLDKVAWQMVPATEFRQHEDDLWNSVDR
jgi:hypothetical protein